VSKAEVQADRAEEEVRESDVELPHPMQPAIDASAALTTNLASSAASTRPDLIVWGESLPGVTEPVASSVLRRR